MRPDQQPQPQKPPPVARPPMVRKPQPKPAAPQMNQQRKISPAEQMAMAAALRRRGGP